MPRLPLHPASGHGIVSPFAKAIRLVRYGCANRPFYHIVVMDLKINQHKAPVEQVGSYDPMPNEKNEKLVAFNYERIQHWYARGAKVSNPVLQLLGLAGFFPVHPKSYITAWRNRRQNKANREKEEQESQQLQQSQN